MKLITLAPLALFLVSGVTIATETPPTPASAPLQPQSACLVPEQVKNWGVIDNRRLVVETLGRRYYDIQLTADCSDLQTRPRISFRDGSAIGLVGTSATLTKIAGAGGDRICGDIGDAVIPHGSAPGITPACDIARIRRIDRRTFDGVFGKSVEAGNALLDAAADQPAGSMASGD